MNFSQLEPINERLGALYTKDATTFRVWSTGANQMDLILYDDPEDAEGNIHSMTRNENNIYEIKILGDLKDKFYNFRLNGTVEATDPYAISSYVNSSKSAVIDLTLTNPPGWSEQRAIKVWPRDAIIYELSVKDFTVDATAGTDYPGKFMGLAQSGTRYKTVTTGLDHIKELGITHVQLMPVNDFISVDESPECFYEDANYNWGYDPELYNVPEGSYSTDPKDPYKRIIEYKSLIQSLHNAGIGVVMDVVYNHTFKTKDSNFNILSPNYFYRQWEDGSDANGSGCGNEIATEKPMVRKFILDSLRYWVEEYRIDGFRFDLMGLMDQETMDFLVEELRKINPYLLMYGEPWTALPTPLEKDQCIFFGSQRNKNYAFFNATFRDAIKGDNDGTERGFIQGNYYYKNAVERGIVGSVDYSPKHWGLLKNTDESINYYNCHDNLIIQDKIMLSVQDPKNILAVNKLAFSILIFSQGIPFFHAGNEFMRSKNYIANSYNAGTSANAVDWMEKIRRYELFDYYKQCIDYRKNHNHFKLVTEVEVKNKLHFINGLDYSVIGYSIEYQGTFLYVFHNANLMDKAVNIKSMATNAAPYEKLLKDLRLTFDLKGLTNKKVQSILLPKLSTSIFKLEA